MHFKCACADAAAMHCVCQERTAHLTAVARQIANIASPDRVIVLGAGATQAQADYATFTPVVARRTYQRVR
jgi:hypothetical protein